MHTNEHHAIVGAGLIGGLWALMLAQKGIKVSLYDRRPDPRKAGIDGGRSINLSLSDRGWKAIEMAGVDDLVREIAIPVKGRVMHDLLGNETFQQYGTDEQFIYSVSRGGLNKILVEAAERHELVEVLFDHPCSGYSLTETGVNVNFKGMDAIHHDRVYGTDGVFSAIRGTMTHNDRFDYHQKYLPHGYKEIEMSANEAGEYRIARNGLHIWPRGKFMLMALPNPGGSFTCTLFAPFDGEDSFGEIKSESDVVAFFSKHFPDSLQHLPNLQEEWKENPMSSMCTVSCFPWNDGGRVALLGDSAHAIVPFYGQGMNSGFEDCSTLSIQMDQLLAGSPSEADWTDMFQEYTSVRKPAADAILDLALHNYIVMRDKTGDPHFQLQKKIEANIAKQYSDKWQPLYTLVTFSHTPYHEAFKRGEIQQAVMNLIMQQPDIENRINDPKIAKLAVDTLDKYLNGELQLEKPEALLSTDV